MDRVNRKLSYNGTELTGNVIKQCSAKGIRDLSNVSQTKHTAALGMVTKVFSGVGKVRVPETKTATPSRPYA